jgi:hypothetical protein
MLPETDETHGRVRWRSHALRELWRGALRYLFHLFIVYLLVRGTIFSVSEVAYRLNLWITKGQFRVTGLLQFFFSHLPILVIIPGFLAGLMVNARFRHKVASYAWILPVAILAVAFLFGPGMYPTMLWDSDFSASFRHFFGSSFHLEPKNDAIKNFPLVDWLRAVAQLTFSMPAFTAIAYSIGASLGMSRLTKRLQELMGRF